MGRGIGEVLTFAVGVAISPVPIIAVILMLFSRRAHVNGRVFLLGWVLALGAVSGVVYALAHASNASRNSSGSDPISWAEVVLGALLLLVAAQYWRHRLRARTEPPLPKWIAGVDALTPSKALGLGLLLAGANPKNLVLAAGAAAGLAQLGLSTVNAVVSLIVFVVIASLTIACPVVYYLIGGEQAKTKLDELKDWLRAHNAAVMVVLFVVFGVYLIANGLPSLT